MWSLTTSSHGNQTYDNDANARLGSRDYVGYTNGTIASYYWDTVNTKGGAVNTTWNSESGVFTFPEGGVYIVNLSIFLNTKETDSNSIGRVALQSLNGASIFNSGTSDVQNLNFNFETAGSAESTRTSSWVVTPNALDAFYIGLSRTGMTGNFNIYFNRFGHTVLEIIKIA